MDERGNLGNIHYVRVGDLYIADLPLFMRKGPSHPDFEANRSDFHDWCEENKGTIVIGLDAMTFSRDHLMHYLLRWSNT